MQKRRKKQIAVILLALATIGVCSGVWILFHHEHAGTIPENLKKQLSFIPIEPKQNINWHSVPNTTTYDKSTGVLSMVITSNNLKVTLTEQAQPESFSEVPQVYPALLNKLNQYEDIQTSIGTVTLTRPKELNGGQTAVASLRQTLIFIRPSTNLSESQWKDFFNSLAWD